MRGGLIGSLECACDGASLIGQSWRVLAWLGGDWGPATSEGCGTDEEGCNRRNRTYRTTVRPHKVIRLPIYIENTPGGLWPIIYPVT